MPIRRAWRPFTERGIKTAPERPEAYELGDAKDTIVYIRSSRDSVRSRLLEHKEMRKFVPMKHFRFKLAATFEDPRDMEHAPCESFKRTHNGKLPRLQQRAPSQSWW